jgi:hypothetical protein
LLPDVPDPTQIIRIGMAATYVDRLDGCRAALWRVVRDGREGGAVASMITALLELAWDDLNAGHWDEAEQLVDEVIEVCEAHGYRIPTWSGRYIQAVVAAARGDDERTRGLTDALVQWGGPRGIQVGLWHAWQARGLAALGRGDVEEAYQLASRISRPGLLAPHVPFALFVLMDLVEAAVRTGRDAEVAAHVVAMGEANLAALSPRLALMVGGCAAMVAPDDTALALFQETLARPGIERWQFDLPRASIAAHCSASPVACPAVDAVHEAFRSTGNAVKDCPQEAVRGSTGPDGYAQRPPGRTYSNVDRHRSATHPGSLERTRHKQGVCAVYWAGTWRLRTFHRTALRGPARRMSRRLPMGRSRWPHASSEARKVGTRP